MAFLDNNGLQILWSHIVDRLSAKADKTQVDNLSTLVGDTAVSEQIAEAVADVDLPIIIQEEEPEAQEGVIWLKPAVTTTGAVDFIVEQGVSGMWTYRKWNSGIAECWGRHTATGVTWSAWGSMYSTGDSISFPEVYPFTFASRPVSHLTPVYNAENCWLITGSHVGDTTRAPRAQLGRGAAGTSTEVKIDYYVIGQWK